MAVVDDQVDDRNAVLDPQVLRHGSPASTARTAASGWLNDS